VGPSTGLNDVERRKILSLLELELRPLGRLGIDRMILLKLILNKWDVDMI
jgi:hypothetical protein